MKISTIVFLWEPATSVLSLINICSLKELLGMYFYENRSYKIIGMRTEMITRKD